MRVTRVHCGASLAGQSGAELEGAAANHVSRVLRLRTGAPITLFNGDGWDYPATITALDKGRVKVALHERVPARSESPLLLTLVQGVARGERMDLVIQKSTELGVSRIVPVLCERSVMRLDAGQAERKLEHWRAIAAGAAEQSGRARVPAIDTPLPIAEWLGRASTAPCRMLLQPDSDSALAEVRSAEAELLIGPEGGLTDSEIALARTAGFAPRALGPRILRTETAAIAAIAILQAACGDLN